MGKYPYILNNYTGEHEKLLTKFGDSKLHAHGVISNKAEISCQGSIPPYRQQALTVWHTVLR